MTIKLAGFSSFHQYTADSTAPFWIKRCIEFYFRDIFYFFEPIILQVVKTFFFSFAADHIMKLQCFIDRLLDEHWPCARILEFPDIIFQRVLAGSKKRVQVFDLAFSYIQHTASDRSI